MIGNSYDGWYYYSKNGTSNKIHGESEKYNNGDYFKDLDKFKSANSKRENQYDHAFSIKTTSDQDITMRNAAQISVLKTYDLYNKSCIDVPTDALKSIGLKTGPTLVKISIPFLPIPISFPLIPIHRFEIMQNSNKSSDVTNEISEKK